MNVKQQYPELANFLEAYLADSDLDESDIAREFVVINLSTISTTVIEQSRKLLLQPSSFPWQELRQLSNRYFEDLEDAYQWFNELVLILENTKASNPY